MRRAWHALAAYVVITLAATWPLAAGLGRDVAWDLGDSLLNMWILAWDVEQFRAILSGDFSRTGAFFDANIFHPAPLTLAYSEHLIPQALQILPVYLLTGNPILCYNLLFLSTFVLSGLGTYLLVRELTGNAPAAFVAGLLFAFAPYRVPQSSHLQVLSSQWMPFALYGLTRYADTGRLRALAGASLALLAQGLSSGYYLLYFTPFAAAYALWETWRRGLLRQARTWAQLSCAAALVVVVTVPFVVPYAQVRSQLQMTRPRTEVVRFSADVYSYATAFSGQRIWGRAFQAFPKPEGELFPGVVPILLALLGLLWGGPYQARRARPTGLAPHGKKKWPIVLLSAAAAVHIAAALLVLAQRRMTLDLWGITLRMSNVSQLLLRGAVAFVLLLVLSPDARAYVGRFMRERGFFVIALVAALWLSLGPSPQTLGRALDLASPYGVLFEFVPGFDGVRVPARFAMIAVLMLAILAGYGAAVLARRRRGHVILAAIAAAFLIEATSVPFLVNGLTPPRGFATPEARVYRPARAPAIYREVASVVPADGVVAELPLGSPDFDLRAVYYSTAHWRRIVNGYSGFVPPHYGRLTSQLSELPRHPDISLQALRETGATHVIVHEGAFLGTEGPDTSAALRQLGGAELFRDGADVLLALPR